MAKGIISYLADCCLARARQEGVPIINLSGKKRRNEARKKKKMIVNYEKNPGYSREKAKMATRGRNLEPGLSIALAIIEKNKPAFIGALREELRKADKANKEKAIPPKKIEDSDFPISGLAVAFLDEKIKKGGIIKIPSWGIKITSKKKSKK